MKCVLFVNFSRTWGGGEMQHLEIACGFKSCGYNVTILTQPHSELSYKAQLKGIDVVYLKVNKLSFLSPFVLLKLRRILKTTAPHAVILNSPLELKHLTFCTSYKEYNLIYRRGFYAAIKPSFLNIFCIKRLSYLVVISKFIEQRALSSISKYCRNNPVIIHNGISFTENNKLPNYDSNTIIAVGRLDTSKRFDLLIKAMPCVLHEIPNAKLIILGEGHLRPILEEIIRSENLTDNVTLAGFQNDVASKLRDASVFVHAAMEEAFGVVFLEAMQQKLPCIAFRGHAADEIIEHEKTGLLVDDISIEGLAKSIVTLLSSNDKTKMGIAGYERLKEHFTIEKSVSKFRQLTE